MKKVLVLTLMVLLCVGLSPSSSAEKPAPPSITIIAPSQGQTFSQDEKTLTVWAQAVNVRAANVVLNGPTGSRMLARLNLTGQGYVKGLPVKYPVTGKYLLEVYDPTNKRVKAIVVLNIIAPPKNKPSPGPRPPEPRP